MKVLVINAGSSSLKYQIIDMKNEIMLCKGVVERIGFSGSLLKHQHVDKAEIKIKKDLNDHTEALQMVIESLMNKDYGVIKDVSEIIAVGHRVLHSGEDFDSSVIIDKKVIKILKKNIILGPLHMPANIACIEACKEVMPDTPMVAVFDTGFHSTMPQKAFMYAIPYEDYKKYKIRKYGFHGTSHKYVSGVAQKYLDKANSKIITCHLGNGSSMSAVVDGKCVDTSMGLTPLEGLIMGTRSGDIDPTVLDFIVEQKGITTKEALEVLNKKSGFLGICGNSDFRDMEENAEKGDKRSILCIDMFQYRIKKFIGSYIAAMNGLDLIVFTGGIGENAWKAREAILKDLECFGIEIDFEYNKVAPRDFAELHTTNSKVKVVIIATNEEVVIARETMELINK